MRKPLSMAELRAAAGRGERSCREQLRRAGVVSCGTRLVTTRRGVRHLNLYPAARALEACRRGKPRARPLPPLVVVARAWAPPPRPSASGQELTPGELEGMPAHCRDDIAARLEDLSRRAALGLPLFDRGAA